MNDPIDAKLTGLNWCHKGQQLRVRGWGLAISIFVIVPHGGHLLAQSHWQLGPESPETLPTSMIMIDATVLCDCRGTGVASLPDLGFITAWGQGFKNK